MENDSGLSLEIFVQLQFYKMLPSNTCLSCTGGLEDDYEHVN